MSPDALKTIKKFQDMPLTKEKAEISRAYAADEITGMEFFFRASDYLKSQEDTQ